MEAILATHNFEELLEAILATHNFEELLEVTLVTTLNQAMQFKSITSPHGSIHTIPVDLNLVFPQSDLPKDKQHFLVYIPWDDKYLKFVPAEFQDFSKLPCHISMPEPPTSTLP